MRLCRQLALVSLALLGAGAAAPVHAQRWRFILAQQRVQRLQQLQQRQLQRQQRVPNVAPNVPRPGPEGNANKANTLPPKAFQRLQNMNPQQQERFLQNNSRFQNLPADQQAQIRERLQDWNKLTPNQQQELRVRQQIWEQLTPQQRRNVQQVLLPRWQQLPAERQKVILQRLHALRDLSESDRNARLNDPMFLQGLNSDDREMLRQFAHLHVGMAPD